MFSRNQTAMYASGSKVREDGGMRQEELSKDHPMNSAPTFVSLPGVTFRMGSNDPIGYAGDGEGPARDVTTGPVTIGATTVTNADFCAFVTATQYQTTAESQGVSFVFGGLLPDDFEPTRGVASAPWWREVDGASWQHPEGPATTIDDRLDHPVVHVSWFDAVAFCQWRDCRLPTEAEWEYAARGGLDQARFPWGDELTPNGVHQANVWQGAFPAANSLDDGWLGPAPVGSFPANGFGLFDTGGNVWEWCADWFGTQWSNEPLVNPAGPPMGTHRVMRGGSYLCHESYCFRFRAAARSCNTPDSATGNIGFRVCSRDSDSDSDIAAGAAA